MEPAVVDGNGTETGHIIVTTIGGRNGQPKQVKFCSLNLYAQLDNLVVTFVHCLLSFGLQTISYMAERIVGQGSFGVVFQVLCIVQCSVKGKKKIFCEFTIRCILNLLKCSLQAKCLETGETVAIKKVLQDKRYKNRELQTMRLLDHPNVVSLKHCFFSTTEKDELFLNLVLEYVPETVHRVIRHYNKMSQRMPMIYVKLYAYQVSFILYFLLNNPIHN